MAPSKKKNGFYFFMKEYQAKEERRGVRYTMASLPNVTHPIWNKMSLAEREPYNEMAKRFNNDPNMKPGKLASDGTSVEENMREENEREQAIARARQKIKDYIYVDQLHDEEFKEINRRRMIYLISFNILCKTETEYIPIEIGIVEYSIQHGINREYHKLIHPGSIPTGYAGEAKRISEDKHLIDIFSGESTSSRNYMSIYQDIKSFARPDGDDFPPLFSLAEEVEQTQECLKWLQKKAKDRVKFDVLNSTHLLFELRRGVNEPVLEIVAKELMSKTCFNYHPASRCEFHDEKDCYYCALSVVKRQCFLISDAVTELFGCTITENHLPVRYNEEKQYAVSMPLVNPARYQTAPATQPPIQRPARYPEAGGNLPSGEWNTAGARRPPIKPSSLASKMSGLNLDSSQVTSHGLGRGKPKPT